ncbi:MAG: hypothetical protein MRJ68_18920 [Nitrospira sp.]|nr:hypothetical protein [Nitrospira sp.]
MATIMLTREDITQGAYLRLCTSHLGNPAGLIGVVYAVSTDQAGEWYFQLRYLNASSGTKTRPGLQWSLNLHEDDLEHFERLNTWEAEQFLKSGPSRDPRAEEMKLPTYCKEKAHPNQLRLFEDF